jgi:hypothetical protein
MDRVGHKAGPLKLTVSDVPFSTIVPDPATPELF